MEYLTKYTAKGEPRSPVSKKALNSIVRKADYNTEPHRVIKQVAAMKTLGKRDYAAQEAMHCITNCEKLVLFSLMVQQWNDPV